MFETYTLCVSKEFNRITEEKICNEGEFTTLLDGKSVSKTKLYSSCTLSIEHVLNKIRNIDGMSLEGYSPSKEDGLVMNGIFTIIDHHGGFSLNRTIEFSTRELIKIIRREQAYEPAYEEIKKITKSIYALSATWLSIELFDNRKNKTLTYKRRAPLLHIEAEEFYQNNKVIVSQWKLVAVPILYDYASLEGMNRLRSIKSDYYPKLQSRKVKDTLIIMDYIALHIENIKRGYYKTNKMLYSYNDHGKLKGLLPRCGIYEENYVDNKSFRNKKAKIHKIICNLLEEYKSNGLIKNYEIIKKGKCIDGFLLTI